MSYKALQKFNRYYYDQNHRMSIVRRHGSIISLSSGVNHLPAPSVIREQIAKEFLQNFFYSSYSGNCGNLLFLCSAAFELKERLNGKLLRIVPTSNICCTFGATGGLSACFNYLAKICHINSALVLGLNYSFFSLWCDNFNIKYHVMKSNNENRILPTISEVIDWIRKYRPDLVILTQPSNPSGELYSKDELSEILQTIKKSNVWLLIDEVPNMANSSDFDPPHMLEVCDSNWLPEKWIFVNSFSKSRSLAGLRYGYVIAHERVIQFLNNHNDMMYWSPQNIASSALAKDMLLRVMSRKMRRIDVGRRSKEIKKILHRFSQWVRILSPYSDDMSRLYNNLHYINCDQSWETTLHRYEEELTKIHEIYSGNWKRFIEIIRLRPASIIQSNHGFNHCVQLRSSLKEWEFCSKAFDDAGLDFYTESVFSESDDTNQKKFWIRISCAVEPTIFQTGINRFAEFLSKYS
jgi:aspartate/methionine/tyrosine aminotransferase